MEIIYQTHPIVSIAGNQFINTPTVIQFEQTPLLQIGKFESAGFTTRFPVYHGDGTKLAVVDGCRIHLTAEGKNANINVRHLPEVTAFDLEGKTIMELRRHGPAALEGAAELYATEGILIRAADSGLSSLLKSTDNVMMLGNSMFVNCQISGWPVGIHFYRVNGEMQVGLGSNGIVPQ